MVRDISDQDHKANASEIKKLLSDGDASESLNDVAVTVDGSWLSCGRSSRHGLVAVISADTGKVLDHVYLSTICRKCATKEESSKSNLDYLEWFLEHEKECTLTHEGSAQSMEAVGAQMLFSRSIEKLKIRYNPYIGDGDSPAYKKVMESIPYGPAFMIEKEECVGHVQKRMGTRLQRLRETNKGKKLSDGKGLTGKELTLSVIDSFHNFYGRAI